MSFSIQRAVSDGTMTLLPISIEYFDREEISVLFDGVLNARQWAWVGTTDKTLSFTPAVANSVEVMIVRSTDLAELRHQFSLGAQFTAESLDESLLQILHIAQEAREGSNLGEIFQNLNFHGLKAINMGDGSAPMDAVNHRQMEVHDATIVGYMNAADASADAAAASAAAALTSELNAAQQTAALQNALAASSGASLVGFIQPMTGAVARTVRDKQREFVNALDFIGADKTGGTDSSAAFQAAGNAYPVVHVTGGTFRVDTAPSFSTPVTFVVHADAVLTGAGGVAMGYTSTTNEQYLQVKTTGSDLASVGVRRNANHTGGTPGNVSCGFRSDIYVGAGVANYEWGILGRVYNQATSGENVGVYGQGIKASTGPTWGMVAEAIDSTQTDNPTSGLVGIEVDCRANGTDNNNNRIGIDVVINKQNAGGAANVVSYGVRVQNGGDSTAIVKCAFSVDATADRGLDTSQATINQAAIRMASGQAIGWDAPLTHKTKFDGTGIVYQSNGNSAIRLNSDGSIQLGGSTLPMKLSGSWATGTQTSTLGTNKPGSTGGTPAVWASMIINGGQYWFPLWSN